MANGQYYKSTGTIRIRVHIQRLSCSQEIFFTPSTEHFTSDGDKQYAVFFPTDNDIEPLVIPYDAGKDIKMFAQSNCSGLVAAATQQMLVEVEVEWLRESGSVLLRNITIPASGKSK